MARKICNLQVCQYFYPFVCVVVRSRKALRKGRKETGKTGFAMEVALEGRALQVAEEVAGNIGYRSNFSFRASISLLAASSVAVGLRLL